MFRYLVYLIILILPTLGFSDNKTASNKYVELLAKVKNTTYVYKQPDTKSKKLRKIYKGSKIIVIQDVNADWYLVKYNNVRTGYVLKKYIELRYTLKKEVKRVPYQLKKLEIDLDSMIKRYNFYMKESRFFMDTGYVPVFKLHSVKKSGDTVTVSLLYDIEVKKGVKVLDKNNPFADILQKFIEVIFFKMFIEKAKNYQIVIFTQDGKSKNEYAKLRYVADEKRFFEIKNYDGKIWDYIESTVDPDTLFKYLPVKGDV
ncbi:hypothetical protein DEFDS_0465 [Deferribacter desulfuricans SSM1]|uniref:SH3b domain-containing protein n=1 Tax=Deferribacter desulfuricans (strain DSM 14783 / JCM 11476 / NBRC 101012 / SSM1) TaxID=639282 RepID=D3PBI6_DEFDS|nr:SH3 domain-containing protein [Deferribacter desulfuricans]BAI79959.1 hypothetical protein DEFDS_0465 [Deferribacter desulfuricans SSM1]